MKVRVKLFWTLPQRYPDYDSTQGLVVEIPDGATIKDLLGLLGISESQKAVVAIDGRIQEANDKMPSGACVQVFQPVHGG